MQKTDGFLRHYSYECKAIAQERPYVSRPSRTQQLQNPKLVPKLTSDVPNDLLRKLFLPPAVSYEFRPLLTIYSLRKGVADELLAKAELERGRKRDRQSEDPENMGSSKRMRSASASSVSTISTNMSRSPYPRQSIRRSSLSKSPLRKRPNGQDGRYSRVSRSPPPRTRPAEEKKRRRDSYSSSDSIMSDDANKMQDSRERGSSRSTRRKYRHASPPARGRGTESRSPQRGRRRFSDDREPVRDDIRNGMKGNRAPVRERSLSPFSKRLALTQAMNVGN
ncbi:hypothetical protein LSUE1_G001940 [Lachnellula suecica]|uniref:Uncharacterized protein n=1 Tax=Lachnellula suecica TaxID=602035 RepID=A0A8T9CD13_9HELO|nr:hypothetical protein LSUE1_G001940 [Lachnellula suecica]